MRNAFIISLTVTLLISIAQMLSAQSCANGTCTISQDFNDYVVVSSTPYQSGFQRSYYAVQPQPTISGFQRNAYGQMVDADGAVVVSVGQTPVNSSPVTQKTVTTVTPRVQHPGIVQYRTKTYPMYIRYEKAKTPRKLVPRQPVVEHPGRVQKSVISQNPGRVIPQRGTTRPATTTFIRGSQISYPKYGSS